MLHGPHSGRSSRLLHPNPFDATHHSEDPPGPFYHAYFENRDVFVLPQRRPGATPSSMGGRGLPIVPPGQALLYILDIQHMALSRLLPCPETALLTHSQIQLTTSHSRHLCRVTQPTCLLWATADMSAAAHSRHICCGPCVIEADSAET